MSLENVVFLDTETTGLSPERHEIWEVGLIDGRNEKEYVFQLPLVNFKDADLIALNIGRFHERYLWGNPGHNNTATSVVGWNEHPEGLHTKNYYMKKTLEVIEQLTRDKHIVGAIPSFDTERLARLFYRFDLVPSWHYHLIDVEALAIGYINGKGNDTFEPPWKSDNVFQALGIDPPPTEEKHTALGDARQCMRVYKKVMGLE